MAYDRDRGRVVLMGGQPAGSSGTRLADTWEWDGTNWTQVVTATTPGGTGLLQPGATYDRLRERVVLSGGFNGSYLSNTWEYDGVDWTDRGPVAGFERAGGLIGYVLTTEKTLSFGGFNASAGMLQGSAEYQTSAVAALSASGSGGCSGAGGTPVLATTGRPWLGDSFSVTASGLAPTAIPFMVLGFSTAAVSLAPYGGAGCQLLASPDDSFLLAASAGSATWSATVPVDPNLIGVLFYNQCLALGAGLTVVSSDRADAVLGAR